MIGPAASITADRAVTDALAGMVAAIGGADFAERFLDVWRALASVELCSVFRSDEDGGLVPLFATGVMPALPDFPRHASRDYARSYSRSDAAILRLARGGEAAPTVVRRRAADIADPAWRAACYDRAGVIERVSIVAPGRPAFVANGYVTAAPFSTAAIGRLESHAALLVAALRQHSRLEGATGHLLDEGALVESLLALQHGLSAREAEVAAALILGRTQDQIAGAKHLSPATVVTYRRRAYGKLGVATRRDLAALHRRLMVEPGCRSC